MAVLGVPPGSSSSRRRLSDLRMTLGSLYLPLSPRGSPCSGARYRPSSVAPLPSPGLLGSSHVVCQHVRHVQVSAGRRRRLRSRRVADRAARSLRGNVRVGAVRRLAPRSGRAAPRRPALDPMSTGHGPDGLGAGVASVHRSLEQLHLVDGLVAGRRPCSAAHGRRARGTRPGRSLASCRTGRRGRWRGSWSRGTCSRRRGSARTVRTSQAGLRHRRSKGQLESLETTKPRPGGIRSGLILGRVDLPQRSV
jgi:hypothetical protein